MILVKTQYKTYNIELIAIVKIFKTGCHYFKSCKHNVVILINYNNFRHFIDIKNLSFY